MSVTLHLLDYAVVAAMLAMAGMGSHGRGCRGQVAGELLHRGAVAAVVHHRRHQRGGRDGRSAHQAVRLLYARHRHAMDCRHAVHGLRAVCGDLPDAALATARLESTPEFFCHRYGADSAACRVFRAVYGMFMAFGWGAMLMGYILGYTCQSIADPCSACRRGCWWSCFAAIVTIYSALGGFYGVGLRGRCPVRHLHAAFLVSVPIVICYAGGWEPMYARWRGQSRISRIRFPAARGSVGPCGPSFVPEPFPGRPSELRRGIHCPAIPGREEPRPRQDRTDRRLRHQRHLHPASHRALATGLAALYPGLTDEAAKGNYARLLAILPPGVVGLLMVGELAVIIGAVASLTNWGASVVTNDVYRLHLVKARLRETLRPHGHRFRTSDADRRRHHRSCWWTSSLAGSSSSIRRR